MTTIEYHRPARFPARLEHGDIAIKSPPPKPVSVSGAASVLQFIMPLVGVLGSVAYIFISKISPTTLIATGAILVASVGGGAVLRVVQGRTTKQRAEQARTQYEQYIEDVDTRLKRDAEKQRQNADALYPAPQVLVARLTEERRDGRIPERLWERRWHDEDFLDARVGSGIEPLSHKLTLQQSSANPLDVDTKLDDKARNLVHNYQNLSDMPKVVSLRRAGSVAICGQGDVRREFARALLIGLAFNHAPTDLRFVLYAPPEAIRQWSWLKWLPHTRALQHNENSAADAPERLCMIAETVEDFATLLDQQVVPEFERRAKARDEQRSGSVPSASPPHFIILVDGYTPQGELARLSTLSRMLERVTADANQNDSGVDITILSLTDSRETAPTALFGRFEIQGAGIMGTAVARYQVARQEAQQRQQVIEAIGVDPASIAECEEVARALAPISMSTSGAEVDLSHEVRLLPLLGYASVDSIDTQRLWEPRTPDTMMVVPVGMCEDGTPLVLNLREPAEGGIGPHGMLIGQPGMGKTEFLRTLVLGLAMTHSPEEVTFVFVDYKGDTAFNDLATLPHCVGLVTRVEQDSSGDLIQRLHQALDGERARRAAILGGAKVDKISAYHAMRRARPEMEPLPYLVIVIDEYAALLADHQELKDLFLQIGQQGRSPGMNMILASQSPSGGNLQQLETYLSYRVSVRTASPADSTAALGTADAYYLPNFVPGLAYLKAGEQYYRKFRTARATTPYQFGALVGEGGMADVAIREFNEIGALIPRRRGSAPGQMPQEALSAAATERPQTELIATAQRLLTTAQERNWPKPHQVWVPPLPRVVTLGQIAKTAPVGLLGSAGWSEAGPGALARVPLGLADHVREQRQSPYVHDFTGQAGHLVIVGRPQSGASTLLKTVVSALIATTTPRDAQLYLINAGGGRLETFEKVPHVGTVCGGSESEVVRRMTAQVRGVLRRREERFRRERIGGMGAFREQRASLPPDGDDVGADIFLVIDNLNALRTEAGAAGYDPDLMADLAAIAGMGLTYGVHLVISAQTDPPAALANNLGGRIELRLADPRTSALGKMADGTTAATLVAVGVPGRGVVAGPALFQAALPIRTADPAEIEHLMQCTPGQLEQRCDEQIAALVEDARHHWSGSSAPAVRLLPQLLRESDLAGTEVRPGFGFVLGLEEASFQPFALDLARSGSHLLVYGDRQHGKTSLVRLMLAQLTRLYTPEEAQFVLIDPQRGLLDWTNSPYMLRSGDQFGYALNQQMLGSCMALIKQHLDPRKMASGQLTLEELQRLREGGRSWSGPRIFVFYDDFEPSGPLGITPLSPLGEYVQQTGDIGLHLVVTRQLADAGRGDAVLDRVKNAGSPFLVMGAESLGIVPGGLARGKVLPPGRGFLVRQGPTVTTLQVAYTPPSTE